MKIIASLSLMILVIFSYSNAAEPPKQEFTKKTITKKPLSPRKIVLTPAQKVINARLIKETREKLLLNSRKITKNPIKPSNPRDIRKRFEDYLSKLKSNKNLKAELAAKLAEFKARKASQASNAAKAKKAIADAVKNKNIKKQNKVVTTTTKPKKNFVAPPRPLAVTNAKVPPPRITPKKILIPKVASSNSKTLIKNSELTTNTNVKNIDVKGKLNVSNIKISKGSTIKDAKISTNVKTKDISVAKGSSADIGNVNIDK